MKAILMCKNDFEIKPFSVYMTPKQINESKFYIYKNR